MLKNRFTYVHPVKISVLKKVKKILCVLVRLHLIQVQLGGWLI